MKNISDILNLIMGFICIGLSIYFSWHNKYDQATFNLLLGMWCLGVFDK